MTLSLPIRIFEAQSALQRMTCMWQSVPSFMTRIAATEDALERVKLAAGTGVWTNPSIP